MIQQNDKLIRITTVPMSLNVLLKGQLRFMKEHFDVLAVSSGPEEELQEVEKREGVATLQVEMTRAITPLQDLKAVWQLYKLFKKEKPHIVHTHTPKAGTVGMLAAKLSGVPHRLHTVAGLPLLEATGAKRKLLDTVEKITYACATKVYPNSKGLYNIILEQGYCKAKNVIATPRHSEPQQSWGEGNSSTQKPVIATSNAVEGKLKVIANGSSNGIDTTHFSPEQVDEVQKETVRKALGISPQDFVFIFIGRLVGDKGINELVSAFTRHSERSEGVSPTRHSERSEGVTRQTERDSKDSHSEPQQSWGEGISSGISKLVLVGPFESELDPLQPQTLHHIETNPHIIAVGFQKDVRPYLAISNCLAFPSYREGFPNVVMQAGAMGLPAIVTNINGCNEIIVEGQNGTIIPVKDTNALHNAMKKMMADKNYWQQLQQNARQMICDRYEQRVVWEALLAEYRALGS